MMGETPEKYIHFHELESPATDGELKLLLIHKNPVVVAYAFWGLLKRDLEYAFNFLLDNWDRKEIIVTNFECVVTHEKLTRVMANLIKPHLDPELISARFYSKRELYRSWYAKCPAG